MARGACSAPDEDAPLGLIGAGIQRSLAPALQEEEARHHGLRLHYQLIDLDPAGLGVEALPGLDRGGARHGLRRAEHHLSRASSR